MLLTLFHSYFKILSSIYLTKSLPTLSNALLITNFLLYPARVSKIIVRWESLFGIMFLVISHAGFLNYCISHIYILKQIMYLTTTDGYSGYF